MRTITLWMVFNILEIFLGCFMFAWGGKQTSVFGALLLCLGLIGVVIRAVDIEKYDCGPKISLVVEKGEQR